MIRFRRIIGWRWLDLTPRSLVGLALYGADRCWSDQFCVAVLRCIDPQRAAEYRQRALRRARLIRLQHSTLTMTCQQKPISVQTHQIQRKAFAVNYGMLKLWTTLKSIAYGKKSAALSTVRRIRKSIGWRCSRCTWARRRRGVLAGGCRPSNHQFSGPPLIHGGDNCQFHRGSR